MSFVKTRLVLICTNQKPLFDRSHSLDGTGPKGVPFPCRSSTPRTKADGSSSYVGPTSMQNSVQSLWEPFGIAPQSLGGNILCHYLHSVLNLSIGSQKFESTQNSTNTTLQRSMIEEQDMVYLRNLHLASPAMMHFRYKEPLLKIMPQQSNACFLYWKHTQLRTMRARTSTPQDLRRN